MKAYSATYKKTRKWLIGCTLPIAAICLAAGISLMEFTEPFTRVSATGVEFSSILNANIGKHPLHTLISWDATGENLKDGGRFNWSAAVTGDYVDATSYNTGKGITSGDKTDTITPQYIKTAVNSTLKDDGGNTILEQSPTFTYKRESKIVDNVEYAIYVDSNGNAVYFDSVAQELARKYGFREGKELVFNVNDEGTAARVWSDAVLFTQHIGPAESIPLVSNLDNGRWKDTEVIPDTTMYAFEEGDYIFRTVLTEEEKTNGSVVYNSQEEKYGVWEKYAEGKDGNEEYLQSDGKVKRFAHFFVNDNGSYYYHTDTKQMTTKDDGTVETSKVGGHEVKYSRYDPKATPIKAEAEGGTLDIHGPVYRGNYFIENGRYDGYGTTGAYGGAKLMGQYVTVRMNCDWKAKDITTNIYTVNGKTTSFDYVYTSEKKNGGNYEFYKENTTYTEEKKENKYHTEEKSSDGYTVYYDAASEPYYTGFTPFQVFNELCAFSNGRLNVPIGSYIVLDLNGHTIDRALSADYDKNEQDSAYQYFGSVFCVNEFSRLEVYDSTAFENASDSHISGENKNNPAKNYGAEGGLTTDHKGTITGGYVTHQFTKDTGNGRKATEGNTGTVGTNNYENLKLNVTGDDRHTEDRKNSVPSDNEAKGAAFHMYGYSDLVIHSGTVKGNTAASQYGGAAYILTNASLTMFDGYIINNQAYRIGGGIYLADASAGVLSVYNGVIGYNYGGAGKLTLEQSNDLRENGLRQFRAIENYGGGIALRTKAYCNLYGGEIVGNYSYGPGGGLYIQGSAIGTLAGVTIKGNHTYGAPGGQATSFAPFGGGGGVFVGGTGARIGFRGALQIVDNYRDNTVNNYQGKASENPPTTTTDITYTSTTGQDTRADNLHLPMQEMTKDTDHQNPNENTSNQVGTGDGAPASTNYSVEWNSNSKIIISGPLIEKGIVAKIGVTMQAANEPFNSEQDLVFTTNYTNKTTGETVVSHNSLPAHYFFTSDNPDYSVQMSSTEGMLKNQKASPSGLTWVIEGKGIDADTNDVGAPQLSDLRVVVHDGGAVDFYYKNPNRTSDYKDALKKVTDGTQIDGEEVELSDKRKTKNLLDILKDNFVVAAGSLDFEYSMLNVTSVSVYSSFRSTDDGTITGDPLALWHVKGSNESFEIESTFHMANFRFKLGNEDLVFTNEGETVENAKVPNSDKMYKAIKATDESLSYAGLYSFLYKSSGGDETAVYSNPTFKIFIKQVGVEATRECYFSGTDVTKREPLAWKQDDKFTWDIGNDRTKNFEPNAPYFIYCGGYYYPILSADFEAPVKGSELIKIYEKEGGESYVRDRLPEGILVETDDYVRVVDPEKPGDCLFIRKSQFNGYVMQFRYSNQYFGVTQSKITGGSESVDVSITRDVHFGAHNGGGVEYKTMHKKPGSEVAEGLYVEGVKHAGTYLVTFVASSTNGLSDDTGVFFASNNFAFNAEVRLKVEAAHAEVELTSEAQKGLGYTGAVYENRQIADFDNTSDTNIIPVNDDAVIFRYFLYDDADIWKGNNVPSLDILSQDMFYDNDAYDLVEEVTAQNYGESGSPNEIPGDPQQPLNARTYIVVVTLDLDINYEEYDYVFDKDLIHLVNIDTTEEKQPYVWAYWFTINPADINPYELMDASSPAPAGGNTSVSLGESKSVYYNGDSYGWKYEGGEFKVNEFSAQAVLPTILFSGNNAAAVQLERDKDYTVKYSAFNDKPSGEGQFNYLDASVGLDNTVNGIPFGTYSFAPYNLAVKITFGGEMKNYKNFKPETRPQHTSANSQGTAWEEYDETDEDGAFYVYFRIVPVVVTASASLSYTYDGGDYDRGRYLPPRDGQGADDAWYESIFFLVQDGITTPADLIEHQHDDNGKAPDAKDKYSMSYPGAPDGKRTLDDLWAGIDTRKSTGTYYGDATFYKNRYTIVSISVTYTDQTFQNNNIKVGLGMYAFKTSSANAGTYKLTTVNFDNVNSIDTAPKDVGVMWLLTVNSMQTHATTDVTGTGEVTNFIVDKESNLDVTINQRDISTMAATFNGEAYNEDEPKHFPYSGYEYRPTVELSYTVDQPSEKAREDKDNPTSLKTVTPVQYVIGIGATKPKEGYDYFARYDNNKAATTADAPTAVLLSAMPADEGSEFTKNYTGTRTIDFYIDAAKIEARFAEDGREFVYNRLPHPVVITYRNVSDYTSVMSLFTPSGGFTAPLPSTVTGIVLRYSLLSGDTVTNWVEDVPIDAGSYRVSAHVASTNFVFTDTEDFTVDNTKQGGGEYKAEDAEYNSTVVSGKGTAKKDLVVSPATVYAGGIKTSFTYNRDVQRPELSANSFFGLQAGNPDRSLSPAEGTEYTVRYINSGDNLDSVAGQTDAYADAGTYYVLIDLTGGNFVWGAETQTYGGSKTTQGTAYNSQKRLAIPYTISPATIKLVKPASTTYNRRAQAPDLTQLFSGVTVPQNNGETEFAVRFTPTGSLYAKDSTKVRMRDASGTAIGNILPYYADDYDVEVYLVGKGANNFVFDSTAEAPTTTAPEAGATLVSAATLGTNNTDATATTYSLQASDLPIGEKKAAKTVYVITPLEISATQHYTRTAYDGYEHLDEVADFDFFASGIELTGASYTVTVKQGDTTVATVHFLKDDDKDDEKLQVGTDCWACETDAPGDYAEKGGYYYITRGDDETTHYNFKTILASRNLVEDVGTYDVVLQLSTQNFKFVKSATEADTSSIRAIYTIAAAALTILMEAVNLVYDPKNRLQITVTVTDANITLKKKGTRTYTIKFSWLNGSGTPQLQVSTENPDWKTLEPGCPEDLKSKLTMAVTGGAQDENNFFKVEFFKIGEAFTWNEGTYTSDKAVTFPGDSSDDIGNYWMKATLHDPTNFYLSATKEDSQKGSGTYYPESFGLTADRSHSVHFVDGITVGTNDSVTEKSPGANLPIVNTQISYGDDVTLVTTRRISVQFAEKDPEATPRATSFVLVGWTRQAPTGDHKNGWLFQSSDFSAIDQKIYYVSTAASEDNTVEKFYKVVDSDCEDEGMGDDKNTPEIDIYLYAVWAQDNDNSGTADWTEELKVVYSVGKDITETATPTFPAEVAGKHAGDWITLPAKPTREDGSEWYYSIEYKGITYVLVGWTTDWTGDATDNFLDGAVEQLNFFKSATVYGMGNDYLIDKADADGETKTVTFYGVWVKDTNSDGKADWESTTYTVKYKDALEKLTDVLMPSSVANLLNDMPLYSGENAEMPGTETTENAFRYAVTFTQAEIEVMEMTDKDGVKPVPGRYVIVGWTSDPNNARLYSTLEALHTDFAPTPNTDSGHKHNQLYAGDYLYTVSAADDENSDSKEDQIITLWAVWALDENDNGKADWEDPQVTLQYVNTVEFTETPTVDGMTFPFYQGGQGLSQTSTTIVGGRTITLPGYNGSPDPEKGESRYPVKVTREGITYLLVGWTTATDKEYIYQYNAEYLTPAEYYGNDKYYSVGGSYTTPVKEDGSSSSVDFNAVWAADANNNGVPDYMQEFTVTFKLDDATAAASDVTIDPAWYDLIYKNQRIGTSVVVRNSLYSLVKGAGDAQKRYLLLGFTTVKNASESFYLVEEDVSNEATYQKFVLAGQRDGYIVDAADDLTTGEKTGDLSIVFYAVWGLDNNGDGNYDWDDTKYPVKFKLGDGSEGTLVGVNTKTDGTLNIPTYNDQTVHTDDTKRSEFRLGEWAYWSNTAEDGKKFRLQINGNEYVLIGWTTEDLSLTPTKYLYNDAPPTFTANNAALERFQLKASDVKDDCITLYALWGIDLNGNETPDYRETYTLKYENGTDGTLSQEGYLPKDGGAHKLGETVALDEGLVRDGTLTLTTPGDGGKKYVLVGWTTQEGSHLCDAAPSFAVYCAAGGNYVVASNDAKPEGTDGYQYSITFYAVWGIDENGNGTADYAENFTVEFRNTVSLEGAVFMPAAQKDLQGGVEVTDPMADQDVKYLRANIGGVSYILIGWTTKADAKYVWGSDTESNSTDRYGRYDGEYNSKFYYCHLEAAEMRVYKVDPVDADENGVIALYAVWAIDTNQNGTPDYDDFDRYDVIYEVVGHTTGTDLTSEVLGTLAEHDQLKGAIVTLPGKDKDGGYTYSLTVDGIRYLLVGWTAAELDGDAAYLFYQDPATSKSLQDKHYYTVGTEYTLDEDNLSPGGGDYKHTITLYAVWAEDNEENGKGDKTPDYLQEYAVQYVKPENGTLSPDDLPYTLNGQKIGAEIQTRTGYSLLTGEGKRYTLLGWSAQELTGGYFFTSEADVPETDYTKAGENFTLYTRYSDSDHVIKLYAVWGIDENGNGKPDWEDKKFSIVYQDGSSLTVDGTLPEKEVELLEGLTATLAGMDGSKNAFTVTATKDGKHYVLVGWSTQAGSHLYNSAPVWNYVKSGGMFEAGYVYTLDVLELADEENVITLYAVWAEDNENGGTGDKIPDYAQTYTITYHNDVEGTLASDNLPQDVENQSVGAEVVTRLNYTLDAGGKHYTLIGWSAKALTSYLFEDGTKVPADFTEAQGIYTVKAEDANSDHIITLHAVWGIDMNEDGTPDYAEKFTLRFEAGATGTATNAEGENPLPQSSDELEWKEGTPTTEELLTGYSLTTEDGKKYTLLGWTRTPGAHICEDESDESGYADALKETSYTLDPKDADENGVITFYAIWGRDDNGDTEPDYKQTFTVHYDNGTLSGTPTPTFSDETGKSVGETVTLPKGATLEANGKHYVLMGWTLTANKGDNYLCDTLESYIQNTGSVIIYGADSAYTVLAADADKDGKITFYAIWGIDNDNNNTADWATYTVLFQDVVGDKAPDDHVYEISGPSWPLSRFGLAAQGDKVELVYSNGYGYALSLYKTDAEGNITTLVKRYTLAGWTLENKEGTSYLFGIDGEESYNELIKDGFYNERTGSTFSIPVSAADEAKLITLYAVWVEDNNGNGTPDWDETPYTVTFKDTYQTAITEESGKNVTTDAAGNTLLVGMTATAPTPAETVYTSADGKHYIFYGWTKDEKNVLVETLAVYKGLTLYDGFYTIGKDDKTPVVLYAVWALDNEDGGKGDGEPDFLHQYIVHYDQGKAGGELKPFALPADLLLDLGSSVQLPTGYTLDVEEKHYVLLGWTLQTLDSYLLTEEPKAGTLLGESYTVNGADAKKVDAKNVITLHAVWAIDMNNDGTGNGEPDWEDEKYSIIYETNADGVTAPKDDKTYLSGTTVTLPIDLDGKTAQKDGVNYVFVGWTAETAKDYYFAGEPTVKLEDGKYVVDADDAIGNVITLHAVWAADNDGGKGDGEPDYKQTYSVRFTCAADGTPTPNDLPYTINSLTVGTEVTLLKDYAFATTEKALYVLVGWTTKSGLATYLFDSDPAPEFTDSWYVAAGGSYTVASKDAAQVDGKQVITLYAVWACDKNNSGTPDYADEKYTITYENSAAGEVAGWTGDGTAFTKTVDGILANTSVTLESSTPVTLTAEGVKYLLVGWTTVELSDPAGYCTMGAPTVSFFATGERYQVTADVTLYAVWAADTENGGTGDGEPDYKQSYTVNFVNAEETGTPKLLFVIRNQDVGSEIPGPAVSAMTKDGVRYVLVGWSTVALTSYVVESEQIAVTFIAAGNTYTLKVSDADDEQVITLYAVWAKDTNSNDEADFREDTYTVELANVYTDPVTGGEDLFGKKFEGVLRGNSVTLGDGYYSKVDKRISLTHEGITYLLIGWTTEKDDSLSKDGKMPDITVYRDSYTVNAAHDLLDSSEADLHITLYAVWGADTNGNGIPDWEENAYIVKLVAGADAEGAEKNGMLPATYTYLLTDDTVNLSTYADCRFVSGEHTYQLLGWTLTKGTYLCTSASDYDEIKSSLVAGDTYTVKAKDDEVDGLGEDFVITLYAVWGVDDNRSGGGNKMPDYTEEFTVTFSNGSGGTSTPEAMPTVPPISGEKLLDESGNKVSLEMNYSLELNGKTYVLIGWTLTSGAHLHETAPTYVLYTDTYTVRASDADATNNIMLYAVWGIDSNKDGSPDWNDLFSVELQNGSGVKPTGGVGLFGSKTTGLKVGDIVNGLTVSLSGSRISITVGANTYVLVGWTTKDGSHIYDEAPSDFAILKDSYTVAAENATRIGDENLITLYAVWGLDSNNSGIADWEETLYYVEFVNGLKEDELVGGNNLPYLLAGVQADKEIVLLASNALEITKDGVTTRYTLVGWRRSGPSEIVTAAPEGDNFFEAGVRYTVKAGDADEEKYIRFFAVWAKDGNGNGKADYAETFTVRFHAGTDTGTLTGSLPTDQSGLEGTAVALAASLKLELGGKNFTAFGWTLNSGIYLYEETPSVSDLAKIMQMTAEGAEQKYTIAAADDFDGDSIIELYAVWGVDRDNDGKGDGTPDWKETELYTIEFLPTDSYSGDYTLTYKGEPITAEAFVNATRNTEKKLGELFDMPEDKPESVPYLRIGNDDYVLLGWTYEPGWHLCSDLSTLLALNGYFNSDNVDPYYATADHVIKTYAVWAVDNNHDGTPDFSRHYAVRFENATEGSVLDNASVNGGMPDEVSVQAGMTVNLAAYSLSMKLGGVSYTLIGWAGVKPTASPYYAFTTASAFGSLSGALGGEVYTAESGYPVDLAKMDSENKVTLYAVWGIDANGNGTPDWNDLFMVRFVNEAGGTASGMPAEEENRTVNSIVSLDFGALTLDTPDGEHYMLLGWTLDRDESENYLYTAEPEITYLAAGSSYTVSAADDADGDGTIVLYAVWGKDHNHNGTPDWEENFYTVKFVKDTNDRLTSGDTSRIFRSIENQLTGMEIALGVDTVVSISHNGVRYILIGWTLESASSYLFTNEPTIKYFDLSSIYRVNGADAVGNVITLHAVWAIDGNENDNPDWSEDYTLELYSLFGPESLLDRRRGLKAGDSVTEPATRSVTVNGRNYVLFGWTFDRTVAGDLYLDDPGSAVSGKLVNWPYTVKFSDSRYRVITMYAVWGVDGNRNEKPDWTDDFTLRFTQRAEGVSAHMPDRVTLKAGETYTFSDEMSLTSGGVTYTLIGWTRDFDDPMNFLYTEGYPTSANYYAASARYLDGGRLTNAYTVSAVDADGKYIDFYAVWGVDVNGNGTPDWEDNVIHFADPLGYAQSMPSDTAYTAGQNALLPDVQAEAEDYVTFLGWTLDKSLAGVLAVAADGLYTTTYPVPADSKGLIELYAVWGVAAQIEGWTYADPADKQFHAPQANVTGSFRLELTKSTGAQSHIDFTLTDTSLFKALSEYLTPDLDAGTWELYAGERLIATFTVAPRGLHVEGIAANDKVFDGGTLATLDFSGATLVTLYFGDKVTGDYNLLSGAFADANVGTDKPVTVHIDPALVLLLGEDATNYFLEEDTLTLSADIRKATIDPNGDGGWGRYLKALDKVYDGTTDAEITVLGYGWLSGFNASVKGYTARFEDENVGTAKRVYVQLELEGPDAGNVELSEIVLHADIIKAPNAWIVEFGNTVNDVEGPVAKFGEPTIAYYYDEACTQPLDGDISEQPAGTYYARVTVEETQNWYGLDDVYPIYVEEEPLDITACIMLLVVQVALLGAAIGVVASKRKRDKDAASGDGE